MPPHPSHTGTRYGHAGSSRHSRPVKQSELEQLPSMDTPAWYDPPSPASSSSTVDFQEPDGNLVSNSGHKLENEARWVRKGKMCAWGPSYEEGMRRQRSRKRLQVCLEQLLPEAAAEVGAAPPQNIVEAEDRRRERKRRRSEEKEFRLPHLPSPSPPLATVDLAPMLALPRSYLDIVTSPAMRYSLGDDAMERGLQKTGADLLEGEKGLMQALGRLREVIRVRERDVPEGTSGVRDNGLVVSKPNGTTAANVTNGEPVTNGEAPPTANGHTNGEVAAGEVEPSADDAPTEMIPPLPHLHETDNLWRVSQELLQSQPPPSIEFTVTPEGAAGPSTAPHPKLTPVHRLFTCPTGITFNAIPSPLHPGFQQLNPGHALYPNHVKYNLDVDTQQKAVDDALERIMELLADCNEYKERLEEARERVGDVARARKMVWKAIKRRAGHELDRGAF